MDALVQQLDSYARLGIPKLQHCTVNFEAEDEVEEGKYLLNTWTKYGICHRADETKQHTFKNAYFKHYIQLVPQLNISKTIFNVSKFYIIAVFVWK